MEIDNYRDIVGEKVITGLYTKMRQLYNKHNAY